MVAMSEKSLKQISDGKPLYNEHISFAEKLLKQQFPMLDGLQSPLLSQNNGFSSVQDESIQIHHTGMFHWVTSTSIGGNVQLFDSMFKGDGLSSSFQIQLIAYTTNVRSAWFHFGCAGLKSPPECESEWRCSMDYIIYGCSKCC